MSFSQFLSILYARRASALAFVALLVAAVAAYSLLQPKQYLATAAVMIDARSADPLAAPGAGAAGQGPGYMATQIDLIQSERVAQRALRSLGLVDNAQWRERWQTLTAGRGSYEAWVAAELLRKLEVRPSRESSVVNIAYLSPDPQFAASVANAFVDAYSGTTLDMKVEPARQYNNFFDERVKQLRTALEQAQGRLSAYQQAKGIVATDERLDVENARLSELSSQVVLLQGMAAESSSRQGQGSTKEVVSNMMIGTLTADLSRQEAKLTELKQRLGDRNPSVLELTANVDQLRQRLEAETRRVSSTLTANSNVDRSRLAAAQAALNEQRARVLRIRGQRDEASVLMRDVDNAQRAYDTALGRLSQTSLESQNTFTNVSVLKTASAPPFASSPRVLLNTAVALVVGSLLAIGFVLLREGMDRRLRFDSDVVEVLRQPVLVQMPRGDARQGDRLRRLEHRKRRMVHSLPRAAS
jgi:polysaccharide biosynthesis transport protein